MSLRSPGNTVWAGEACGDIERVMNVWDMQGTTILEGTDDPW